jgi:uncharacterized coiled-coil protein SlyX
MSEVVESRLQRIETKLDKVSDTITQLARIDERLVSAHKRVDRHEHRLDSLEDRIMEAEHYQAQGSGKGIFVERAAWIIFACAVAWLSKSL